MSKKLTAKDLLKDVRELKKLVATDYSAIFDQLNTGKKIKMALKTYGMLSGQGLFDGQLHE